MNRAGSITEESPETLRPNIGHFAWAVVGSTCVPCLFREGSIKYVPVRIVVTIIHSQFSKKFSPEALNTNWCDVKHFFLTRGESDLLNQINKKHCELIFGEAAFDEKDGLVKLDDLIQFYDFLDISYNMLSSDRSEDTRSYKCGFLRINNDYNSIVPYVIKNNRNYLPTFYFDDETKSLDAEAITLDNWDLAYLKFCCKAQGIKDGLIASDQCCVISLEQIKLYFPEDTTFDEFWPTDVLRMLQPTTRVELRSTPGTVGTQQSRPPVGANSDSSRGPVPPPDPAKTQQSTRFEVNSNHSQEPAATASIARTHRSASLVGVDSNHSRSQAPAGTARAPPPYPSSAPSKRPSRFDVPPLLPNYHRTSSSSVTVNSSPDGSSYSSSAAGKRPTRFDVPPLIPNYQRTSSSSVTVNSSPGYSHQMSSGANPAMAYSAVTAFSHPYSSEQSISQQFPSQRKNLDPRLRGKR